LRKIFTSISDVFIRFNFPNAIGRNFVQYSVVLAGTISSVQSITKDNWDLRMVGAIVKKDVQSIDEFPKALIFNQSRENELHELHTDVATEHAMVPSEEVH
jgi:hypothetical protein